MNKITRFLLLGSVLVLWASPAMASSQPDCASVFSFELNTKISLFDLKVLLEPHAYTTSDTYLEVREFDNDFEPARKERGGIAIISAGGRELSDEVTGGMVLSKYEAYFDEDKTKELNKKGGLNAVFYVGQSDECAGTTYTIRFDKNGVLTANGKRLTKVLVPPNH